MKISIPSKKAFWILSYALFFLINILIYFFLDMKTDIITDFNIFIKSWCANIVFLISVYVIYQLENSKIGLASIVLLIGFIFNFGQTAMWSIGIHTNNEIGTGNIYGAFHCPSNREIYISISYSILCFIASSFGMALTIFLKKKKIRKKDGMRECIYRVSEIVAIPVVPLTFLKIIMTINYSVKHGYVALYYSGFRIPIIFEFAERLFFPVLVGILIGSQYRRVKIVYAIFALFMISYCFAGERGNWFYDLIILIWMHHRFYEKLDLKKMLKLGLVAFFSLYILAAMVDIRGYGLANISIDDIIEAFALGNNPVIRFLMEMGGSLSVTLMVMSFGENMFQFGNTFASSFLSSISSKVAELFGVHNVYLSNYLSQDLLGISYGAGFNFFAETYINGSYLYMLLYGVIVAMFISGSCDEDSNKFSFRIFIMCIVTPALCSNFRGESLATFKSIMQIGVLYPLTIWIVNKIFYYRR